MSFWVKHSVKIVYYMTIHLHSEIPIIDLIDGGGGQIHNKLYMKHTNVSNIEELLNKRDNYRERAAELLKYTPARVKA